MHAVILAAGVSKRLRPYLSDKPKCMLEFEGRTLVERHLAVLRWLKVPKATVVTGYLDDILKEHCASFEGIGVGFAHNERFTDGSIISAVCGLKDINDDVILMDADVLYDPEIMQRLVNASGTTFLLDETSKETGEEMMLGAKGGRVIEIARHVGLDWDDVGETVGFFLFPRDVASKLCAFFEDYIEQGKTDIGYEDALNDFIKDEHANHINVGGLKWTEIDFAEDVERARDEILPAVKAKEAALGVSA